MASCPGHYLPAGQTARQNASIMGISRLPLVVALAPRMPWKNSGKKVVPLNIPMLVSKAIITETDTMPFLKSDRGIMGSRALLSINIKTPIIAAAKINMPMMTGEDQGYSTPPQVSASINGTTQSTSTVNPGMSILCFKLSGRICGKNLIKRNMIAMPRGIFTQKTQCQDMESVRNPRSSGR